MDLFENKIWNVERKADSLQITFYGKYTEGLKSLTWALVGFEVLLAILLITVGILDDMLFVSIIALVLMVIVAIFIRLNLQVRKENHTISITSQKITIVKTNGKKTISKEVDRGHVNEIKMTISSQINEGADALLLIISPLAWLGVGASQKDPTPAVYTNNDFIPFFEFGRLNEKQAVISFLKKYLGEQAL